ncbi:peptide ABC transporter substrate-binding protein [Exiguobacterium sp. s193]|uniref:peptide ABC transporter substrate-binding protein n=1 Tax=Exiguobacterium sp. s193 TaxID=2751207 RepID=UPI001BE8DC61|nr:peptide ABC transporter substrate-binding protein [Exiguobacterium sp. s193]
MSKSLKRILVVFIVVAVSLSGFGLFRQKTDQATEPERPQKMTLIESSMPQIPDIALATDNRSQTLLAQLYEGLFVFTGGPTVRKGLARAIFVSDDRLTYTIELKKSKFANGQHVEAQDFVDSFRRVASNQTNSPYGFLFEVFKNGRRVNDGELAPNHLGVKATGKSTLVIELNQPVSDLPKLLAMSVFYPQPKVDEWTDLNGNGPFKIKSMQKNAYQLEKNGHYHQANVVQLDTVNSIIVKNTQEQIDAYRTKQVDMLPLVEGFDEKLVAGDEPTYRKKRSGVFYLAFNMTDQTFKNRKARQVIASSLSMQEINDLPVGLSGKPTNRFVVTDDEWLSPRQNEPVKKWRTASDKKIKIELLNFDDKKAVALGKNIEQILEKKLPGIDIINKNVPIEDKVRLQQSGDYSMTLTGWMPDYPGPLAYLNQFVSDNPLNTVNFDSEKYDKLIKMTRKAKTIQEKTTGYRTAEQQLIEEETVIIPLYQTTENMLLKDGISGLTVPVYGPEYLLRSVKK